MKKISIIILAAALALTLCACGAADVPAAPTPDAAVAEASAPTDTPEAADAPEVDEAALEELELMLDDFGTRIQSGSAGSSLKAAAQAARMMDWALATPLSEEAIYSAAQAHLAPMDDAALTEYLMQIYSLDSAYQQLLQPAQEGLLEAAGVTDCGYPWGTEPLGAVEALMAGLYQRDSDSASGTSERAGDELRAYDDILRAYSAALSAAAADPDGFSEYDMGGLNGNLLAFIYGDSLGYTYCDVNNDGVTELLIGTTNADYPASWVFDLYTLVDGQCVNVFQGFERNVYRIGADCTIENCASASAFNYWYCYYDLAGGALSRKLAIVYDSSANPDAPWTIESDAVYAATEQDAYAVIDAFDAQVLSFDYLPVSSFAA